MMRKRLLRVIRVLNSNWAIGNKVRKASVKLLQNLINRKRDLQKAYTRIIPKTVSIEIATVCNSKCIFCPHGTGNFMRKKEIMDNGLFFRLIDICKKENIIVTFGGTGEYLCDKDFFLKATYILNKGLPFPNLTTNAMLLDENTSEKLIGSGLKCLAISLDSLEKSKYEEIHKGLIFEKVIKNILYFLEFNRRNNLKVSVIVNVVYKDKAREKARFIDFFKEYLGNNFRLAFYPLHNWGGMYFKENGQLKTYCGRIFSPHIMIRVDGSLSLCCQDYNNKYSLGMVKDSIIEHWNSPEIINIRKKHLQGRWDDISICRNCSDIVLGGPAIEIIG